MLRVYKGRLTLACATFLIWQVDFQHELYAHSDGEDEFGSERRYGIQIRKVGCARMKQARTEWVCMGGLAFK